MLFRFRWFLILALLCGGCGFSKSYRVPPWVFKAPQSKEYIYAVGSAGKSLSPWASKQIALKDSLVKLAQSANTQVVSSALKRVYAGSISAGVNMLKTSTDAALKHAEMMEFWADPTGKSGLGYRIYVLVRIKKKCLKK